MPTIDYDALAQKHGADIDYDALAKQHGATSTGIQPMQQAAPSAPQSLLSSLGETSGLKGIGQAISHPLDTLASLPGSVVDELGRSGSKLKEAWNTPNNQPMRAIDRTLEAIPFLGSGIQKSNEQYAAGNTPGAWGSALGVGASLLGPAIAGEGLRNLIPSTARAGKVFESLNEKLANQPVDLNETIKPLQRATEMGARGGTLPKSVSDLLTRSQAIEPMTFPEARDYQGSLSDLSSSDKMALSGRMSGGLKQINKGLFTDIQNAANTAGLGEDYANAMKQYRQASQLKKAGKTIGKAAVGTAGLGGGAALLRDLNK